MANSRVLTAETCRREIRNADELRYTHPRRALNAARKALERTSRLDDSICGSNEWQLLQADAWAVLGSALRAAAELCDAESAFNVAMNFLKAGRANPERRAELAQRIAVLRLDQQRYGDALSLLEGAYEVFEDLGKSQRAAGALADLGLVLGRWGQPKVGLSFLGLALDRLDPRRRPRNFLAAVHNTALLLHELADDFESRGLALDWLRLAQRCHSLVPESLNLLKLRGLLGLAAIRLGALQEGFHELEQAADGFRQLGAVHEQAIVLLHLAGAHFGRGDQDNVRRVAGQLFPIFRHLEMGNEARAALLLFLSAVHADRTTTGLIERVTATMRRTAPLVEGL